MANPNINVDVSGNTAKLQQQINKIAKQPLVIDVSAGGRGAAQPLGKLSGQITEIDKSLAAANARVIAFGAAAGTIFALESAVASLFKSFVNTEKKLQDINVLLNLTDKNLAAFGNSLFDIAGNTAQSFDIVAEAATELSRQGLGVEETLKRTEAALILTRLSGLDAAASVSALTAAINSFQNSALSATEIVNKLANVDAAFAVSSADLANALSRVGSSADDAGISFDELIALVTTAQQITARGGSVIGNSLKTIFTRLGRGKVQEVLGGLGISATDEQGQVKNQVQLLKELAAVYDTLSATQKNYVAEQVGGVFQINILKAALGDLGKEYSIYDRALKTSLSSTDEAIKRNEQLNQTLSALGAQTLANVQKAAASIGEGLFGDAARNVLNLTNLFAEGINTADAESIGGQIGKGVIDGLSKFLAGPGLALATGVIIKLLADFAKYGSEAFRSILGTNNAAKEQAIVQQNIAQFLQNNNNLYGAILKGQVSVSSAAKEYLAVIQQQTAALQQQNAIASSIAKNVSGQVGIKTIGSKQFIATKGKNAASGYLPEAIEQANINARVGGANPKTDKPVTIPNFPLGGNKKATVTAHTGEWAVPNFAGTGGTAIFNRDMKKKYGLPDGAHKISASGFIPNFAKNIQKQYPGGIISGPQSSLIADKNLDTYSSFSVDVVSIGSKASFDKKFEQELNNLNSANPNKSDKAFRFFERNGLRRDDISKLKQNLLNNKNKVPSLLSGSARLVNKSSQLIGVKNNILGKSLFEKYAAKKLGLRRSSDPYARIDLVDKTGKPAAEVKYGSFSKDNIVSKLIETSYGRNAFKNKRFESIRIPSNYKLVTPGFSSGFIPNFAVQKQPPLAKEVIDVGDITANPPLLKNKIISLIYPEISEGFAKVPVSAQFNKQTYRGLIPAAGINPNVVKEKVPDLKQSTTDFLTRQANEFGRILGGTNFIKQNQLPNRGAVEGAAGTAFEGAVFTLFKDDISQRAQNARVDFTNPSANVRKVFNNAPGQYDAKINSTLANDVFSKLLNQVKPGAITQQKSGPLGKTYIQQRSAAVEQLRKEGLTKSADIKKALRERFNIFSKGFVPNFASPKLIQTIGGRITNPNISAKLSEGSDLSNDAYIKAASKLGVNVSGLEMFLKQPGFPLRGRKKIEALSRALGTGGLGRSFNIDALKLGDWNYVKRQFEGNGLTKDDFDKVSKFAQSTRGERAFRRGFKSESAKMEDAEYRRKWPLANGFIPNFAAPKMKGAANAPRRIGYLDGDVLKDPKNAAMVNPAMKAAGVSNAADYHKYLGSLVSKARKSGQLKRFSLLYGMPGSGKSTIMLGGKPGQGGSKINPRIPILTPSDIAKVDEVIDTRASVPGTIENLKSGGYLSNVDRAIILSSASKESQKELIKRRNIRDMQILSGEATTSFGRAAGSSRGSPLNSNLIEASSTFYLGKEKTKILDILPKFKLRPRAKENYPQVEEKKIGLTYGAFAPSTKGHLENMLAAQKMGIQPKDFVALVSREGSTINKKDPHSWRTAQFSQDLRAEIARKTFSGANIAKQSSQTGGMLPKIFDVGNNKFIIPKSGSFAFIGEDKGEDSLKRYIDAGYKTVVGKRTAGVSGTDLRNAIFSGDVKTIRNLMTPDAAKYVESILPQLQARNKIFPEILDRVDKKVLNDLSVVEKQLSKYPARLTSKYKQENPGIADQVYELRDKRDKLKSQMQSLPSKYIKKLGMFSSKYGRFADGFVPNFAQNSPSKINKGIPISQIRAHFDKSGNPIAVTNKINEPNGLKDAIKRERMGIGMPGPIRMSSGGFIPNFAVEGDVAGAAAQGGNSIDSFVKSFSAVALQIALFASIAKAQNGEGKNNLLELRKINKEKNSVERKALADQIKNERSRARMMSTIGPGPMQRQQAFLDIRSRFQNQIAAQQAAIAPGRFQRATSAIKGFTPGLGTAFAAPIVAETIANAIPQQTRSGRALASAASGIGNIGSFAGLGGMIGGPKGAAIGALAGGVMAVVDVINQLNTDLPELQAAAAKAAESLSRNSEASQNLITSYNQYANLLDSNAPPKEIQKAQQAFLEFLSKFDAKTAERFVAALKSGGSQALITAVEQESRADALKKQIADLRARGTKAFERFTFVRRVRGSGPIISEDRKPEIESFSTEAITRGLVGEDLEKRLKELGGIEAIDKDFKNFIGKAFKDIVPENVLKDLPKADKKIVKTFQDLFKKIVQGSIDAINNQKEGASALAKAAGSDIANEINKNIIDGIVGNIDSLLSYRSEKSPLRELESEFLGGDISRDEFIARRSSERLRTAVQIGLSPEEIAVRFGNDLQNVANSLSNNLAQQAADVGFGPDLQKRARELAIPATQQAFGLPATSLAPKEAAQYLKNIFAPSGQFDPNRQADLINQIETLINRNVISADQAGAIFKDITAGGASIEPNTSSIAENFQLAEASSSLIASNLEKVASLLEEKINLDLQTSRQAQDTNAAPMANQQNAAQPVIKFDLSVPISVTAQSVSSILESIDSELEIAKTKILDEASFELQRIIDKNGLRR